MTGIACGMRGCSAAHQVEEYLVTVGEQPGANNAYGLFTLPTPDIGSIAPSATFRTSTLHTIAWTPAIRRLTVGLNPDIVWEGISLIDAAGRTLSKWRLRDMSQFITLGVSGVLYVYDPSGDQAGGQAGWGGWGPADVGLERIVRFW